MTHSNDLSGAVAVVTGGAKGIGAATTRMFLRSGASVAVLDVDEEAGQSLVEQQSNQRCLFLPCDVSEGPPVKEAFETITGRFGGVDLLVNNAGIQRYSTVTTTSEEEWDLVMKVNLKSAFLCARAAIPYMLERGRGVVVNVSSVQGFITQQEVAPYATSKTALLGLTRSIAVDYAPEVRCVAVCPGSVDTPMLRWGVRRAKDSEALWEEIEQMHLTKRVGKPEEIASFIGYLCRKEADFITGQAFRIDGGLGIMVGGIAKSDEGV